ncbi:mitochondrial fission ELM1 family protein [Rickettsia endosymbiont of Ixodes pacificus]|uniref:mitochondrial fission ELM1 family protein n=1 Tax=Rickettsia endosymbiont of Ixodes pacificus TaxID=1133329 RepID=UPI0005F7688B|nr:mitochondrial fission ELM1 family protein [Rickettsia endosymbiont of Ixodes pacificus]KJW03641.1 mitochondrial fission ELM1 family protein [Rickettsia endosymbiont of Ixodes pacificus]
MKIHVLADDRTGNTHQAIALAEKLTEEYTTIKLEYNCLTKLPNFLLKYYPIHIKSELLQDIMAKPLPDMIITAGRRTTVLAFYLKKKFKDIKLIQIMQPSLPYDAFDAVILPYHDLSNSQNVIPWLDHGIQKKIKEDWIPRSSREMTIIPINGAINNITDKFAAANLELQKHYPNLKQFITVIIGGNNKKFNFNEDEAVLFSSLLNKIYTNQQIPFLISFSRRTPQTVKSIIKNNMPSSTIIYDPNEDAGYNPYIAMLAKAKYIISTADSISMCSEAASSGKPLYIFCPPNFNSSKHKIFIKQLVEQKIARIFDKSVIALEEYSYKPLNEAERVAEIIKSLEV